MPFGELYLTFQKENQMHYKKLIAGILVAISLVCAMFWLITGQNHPYEALASALLAAATFLLL